MSIAVCLGHEIMLRHDRWQNVIPLLGDSCVDMVLTDPPYSQVTHSGARTGHGDMELLSVEKGLFSSFDLDEQREWLSAVSRVSRRWVIATMDFLHVVPLAISPPSGLRFVRQGVWVKRGGAPQFTGDRPAQGWEAIAMFHRDGEKLRWNGNGRSSVFVEGVERGEHPTTKPLKLWRLLVELFSDPGDFILDPFAGSGTTLLAAKETGRWALGIEEQARWCDVAKRRLAQEMLFGARGNP